MTYLSGVEDRAGNVWASWISRDARFKREAEMFRGSRILVLPDDDGPARDRPVVEALKQTPGIHEEVECTSAPGGRPTGRFLELSVDVYDRQMGLPLTDRPEAEAFPQKRRQPGNTNEPNEEPTYVDGPVTQEELLMAHAAGLAGAEDWQKNAGRTLLARKRAKAARPVGYVRGRSYERDVAASRNSGLRSAMEPEDPRGNEKCRRAARGGVRSSCRGLPPRYR